MTVSSTTNKDRYEGNGVTDTFAFNGRIFQTTDVAVDIITRATDALVETLSASDYTVTINSDESASIVVDAGKIPSASQDILIRRALSQTQTTELPTGTRFPAVTVENSLDKVTALVQDLSEEAGRSIKLSAQSSISNIELPAPTASEVIGWNSGATALTTYSFSELSANLDVVLTGEADGDFLKYDGSNWINRTAAEVRADLDLEIGTDVQAYDADLTAIGALAKTDGNFIVGNGSTWVAESGATARTSLDVYSTTEVDDKVDVLGATATTSGTSVDVAISSGAKIIHIALVGVSTNGTSRPIMQLGDSGGVETTGYLASYTYAIASPVVGLTTDGFHFGGVLAVNTMHGGITLIRTGTSTWAVHGTASYTTITGQTLFSGTKTLSAELTTLRFTTQGGSDVFDAGSIGVTVHY